MTARPVIIPAMLEQRIEQQFIDSADLKYQAAQVLSKPIAAAVQALLACVTSGGKVLACGNGGSAADAQHFAAEFVGRFERERPELGAIALTTDSSILTAIANDYDFNQIFVKQVRALGQPGDVLLAISTSGNSANILAAMECGISIFHSSVSGLGGCPYAKGATGNVATEDVLFMLRGMGIETGIDFDAVVNIGQWMSGQLQRAGGSRAGNAIAAKRAA